MRGSKFHDLLKVARCIGVAKIRLYETAHWLR